MEGYLADGAGLLATAAFGGGGGGVAVAVGAAGVGRPVLDGLRPLLHSPDAEGAVGVGADEGLPLVVPTDTFHYLQHPL